MTQFVVVRREYVNETVVDEAVMFGSNADSRASAEQAAREASRGYQFFGEDPARGFWGQNTGSNVFAFSVEPADVGIAKTF